MKKSHLDYLRRIIGRAISDRNRDGITTDILRIKAPSTGIHRMVRDIVCDARFYSVMDNDSFWKTYGTYKIGGFVDSIPPADWEKEDESLTLRKEEFLNDWMAEHIIPLSQEKRWELQADIAVRMMQEGGIGMPDPDSHDGSSLGEINLGDGIKDTTNRTGEPAEGLPPNLKEYMDDAHGGNSPGLESKGHQADARFMARIHPSIVRLAEMIGRRGGQKSERRGRFRSASKSDISGATVGNDLSSLLPSEVALLATPESEKIFLDRFARKRLQIFSSASSSTEEGKEKKGPIFICIDTSGSMTGDPEEMAKTLALAIAIVAQKEQRTVCIFNYSFNISFFVLKSLKVQRMKLLRFLSDSYGGGNDENRLFRFIFERMPKEARYRSVVEGMEGADMLVISDFHWIGLAPNESALLRRARKKGMRIFSVAVNMDFDVPWSPMYEDDEDTEDDEAIGYLSGPRFFRKSDRKFRFDDGIINELRR